MPVVSVVIPAFNAERTLARAIDSVLGQTVPAGDVEVIVCDDGSTDGTGALMDGYGDRVVAIHQPNRGRGAARNACLERARGRFIALLDADDWWKPRRLEVGLQSASAHPDRDVFYANAYIVDGNGTIYRAMNGEWHLGHSGWVFPMLLRHNFVPTSTVLVRRAAVDIAGPFDPTLPRSQDLDWLLRLAVHSQFHYDHVPLALYDDQTWGGAEKRLGTYECYLRVLEKVARDHPDLVACHASFHRKSLCDCHTALAAFWEDQADYARAAASYGAAAACAPSVRTLCWKRCLALYRAGDLDRCEEALRDLVADEEYHVEAHFYLGNLLLSRGRDAEAAAEYERALYGGYLYHKFPECVNNLAVALDRLGERDRARQLLQQAMEQQPFYSDAMKNLDALDGAAGPSALKATHRKVF